MFLEKEENRIKDKEEVFGYAPTLHNPRKNLFAIIGLVAAAFLFWFVLRERIFNPAAKPGAGGQTATSTPVASGALPIFYTDGDKGRYDIGTSTQGLAAEKLGFGFFYQKPEILSYGPVKRYSLPLNIKTDAENYYEVSRKTSLDERLDDLNSYGFAVLKDQKELDDKDFFSAYHSLSQAGIPAVITQDFISYYYLNTLKEVFKEIEKNVFYERLWNFNKSMFDIALARYKNTFAEIGAVNDPLLEGQRLELAFFAVALHLLTPEKTQINTDAAFADANKFNAQEADNYGFIMPDAIKNQVEKEGALIRSAAQSSKSPVFLYQRDYRNFSVPENYAKNAKLKNYYLAIRWMQSVFPLYPVSEECENCTLDRDDWLINFYAACSLARDLERNQDLKNEWAIVYKFIAFFNGLRQDLTYLSYHNALIQSFGENYDVENIFSLKNPSRSADIEKLRAKIAQYGFSDIEGAYDRSDPEDKPNLGMRILQTDYWANDFIFGNLSGEKLAFDGDKAGTAAKTLCSNRGEIFRCSVTGYDVINLIYPLEGADYVPEFFPSRSYSSYAGQADSIRRRMDGFNSYTWNGNIYWVVLDSLKSLLSYDAQDMPTFYASDRWRKERAINTALGAWVGLHASEDALEGYDVAAPHFRLGEDSNGADTGYCYVEPAPEYYSELIARNTMMIKMLGMLRVTKDTNSASLALKDYNEKLDSILAIVYKELNNEALSNDDCRTLHDFSINRTVAKPGNRGFKAHVKMRSSYFSTPKVDFAAIVYESRGKKILALGPIYEYSEK